MRAHLDTSKAAELSLQREIGKKAYGSFPYSPAENISSDLTEKEQTIQDISTSLGTLLKEMENSLSLSADCNETPFERLKSVFIQLLNKVSDSEHEAKNLIDNLQALLNVQEKHIRDTESVRRAMLDHIGEGKKENLLSPLKGMKESDRGI